VLAAASIAATVYGKPVVIEETARIVSPDPQAAIEWLFTWDHTQHSSSIAVGGDEMIVVGIEADEPGGDGEYTEHAWLFRRDASGEWKYVTTLDSVTKAFFFGTPMGVAIEGDLAVAGSIFERTLSGWTKNANLQLGPDSEISAGTVLDSDDSGLGWGASTYRKNPAGEWERLTTFYVPDVYKESDGEFHGGDVDISGTQLIVAAPVGQDPSLTHYLPPTAHIFEGGPATWTRTATLSGTAGSPVAIENGVAVVGGVGAHVFARSSGWSQVAQLQSADESMRGAPHIAKLKNGILALSYPNDDHRGDHAGSVSVWRQDESGTFQEVARLLASDGAAGQELGYDLDIDGQRVVATANGAAYVWDFPDNLSHRNLVQDDFEDGHATNWTPMAGSNFSVVTRGGTRVYQQSSVAGEAGSFIGEGDWKNQAIQADVRPTAFNGSDRWFGLVVRRTDPDNYYYVAVRQSNVVELKRMLNGHFATLASAPMPVALNSNYRLRLEAIGTRLRVYVNGRMMVEATDRSLSEGQAGIRMYRTSADYDNIVISPNPQLLLHANDLERDDWNSWTNTGPGVWSRVRDGSYAYKQTNSSASAARAIAGVSTDDQIVQTRVKATAFDNNANAWFGVMTRYVDDGNYYYVTARKDGTISLRKLVNGSVHVLDSTPMHVATGQWYTIRMENIGDALRVYVNGALKLEGIDDSFDVGKYGLVTYRTAAEFDDVVVRQP
jgi:hypothetical protein